jgi:ring-1,2-phenylacetyl-CoA epoxidase subunit PaaC
MAGALTQIGDPAVRAAFREWLLRFADDEMMIGHRHSEWTGFGPDIESDVAMSSIAQEELGHARAFYAHIADDEGIDVDRLAFGRAPAEYRHAALLEQPNGGWEQSMIRLTLYEAFDTGRLHRLAASGQAPFAGLAQTLVREERYHALFADAWLTRLAGGAADGPARVQAALEEAWPDALGLFEGTEADQELRCAGIIPGSPPDHRAAWEAEVRAALERCSLRIPHASPREGGRRGVRTTAFAQLHGDLTEVWRSDPEARW